jgi:hypothetical protein
MLAGADEEQTLGALVAPSGEGSADAAGASASSGKDKDDDGVPAVADIEALVDGDVAAVDDMAAAAPGTLLFCAVCLWFREYNRSVIFRHIFS